MLIEICLISLGLHVGSEVYKKIKESRLFSKKQKTSDQLIHSQNKELATTDTYPKLPQEKINRMIGLGLISLGFATAGFFFRLCRFCVFPQSYMPAGPVF